MPDTFRWLPDAAADFYVKGCYLEVSICYVRLNTMTNLWQQLGGYGALSFLRIYASAGGGYCRIGYQLDWNYGGGVFLRDVH